MIKSEVKKIICKVNGNHEMKFVARYFNANKVVLKCKNCGYIKEERGSDFRFVDSGIYNKKTVDLKSLEKAESLVVKKIKQEKKNKEKWYNLLLKISKIKE